MRTQAGHEWKLKMRLERHLGALLRSLGFFVVVVVLFFKPFLFLAALRVL